jgi:hypothetical protein
VASGGERLRAVASGGDRFAVELRRAVGRRAWASPSTRHAVWSSERETRSQAHRNVARRLKCLPRRPFWASFPVPGCRTGPDRADFATKRRSRTRNGRNRRELGPTAQLGAFPSIPPHAECPGGAPAVPSRPGGGPRAPLSHPPTPSSVIGPSGHRAPGFLGPRARAITGPGQPVGTSPSPPQPSSGRLFVAMTWRYQL